MLNLWDRIQIATAVSRGNAEYRKEMRRGSREAGTIEISKESHDSFKNSTSNETAAEMLIRKKRAAAEAAKKNDDSNESSETVKETPKKEKTSSKKEPVKQTPKQKKEMQNAKAEAECPSEKPGSEKIKTKASSNNEADMSGKMRVEDPYASGVIDMPLFGVKIDTNASGSGNPNETYIPTQQEWAATQNFPQSHPITQQEWATAQYSQNHNFQPQYPQMTQQEWASFQQFIQQMQQYPVQQQEVMIDQIRQLPIQQQREAIQRIMNQASPSHPQVGFGRHKQDQPKKEKPVQKKAEEDNVELDIPKLQMEIVPPTPKKVPDVVNNVILQPSEPVPQPKPAMFDNSAMISKYPFLKGVEDIAVECGIPVQFIERWGLINCIVYNGDVPVTNKGFAIDTGNIIDRRYKIFPGIIRYYEGDQAYPLFINNSNDKGGKKSKNVLNSDLIKGLMIGGNDYPNDRDGLYRPDYRDLNKYLELITIPTKNINSEQRKYIQNRLVEIYNHNFFNSVYVPGSRFRISDFDKKNWNITISNEGVPANYGGPIQSVPPMVFIIEKDRVVRA